MEGKVYWMTKVDSTNEEMKRRLRAGFHLENFDIVAAEFQSEGRGQRASKWESEHGLNLTMSLYFQSNGLGVGQAFLLNKAVSVLIFDYLKNRGIENVEIKWPNDILVGGKKICGILIENTLQKEEVIESVIGIGFNVNQEHFNSNPLATSLMLEEQESFLVKIILEELKLYLIKIQDFINRPSLLDAKYLSSLLGLNELREFEVTGKKVEGQIIGLNDTGKLKVKIEDKIQFYDQKELRFIFN